MFGKKGPKQEKAPKAARQPKKKKQKGSRGSGVGGSKMSPVGLDIGRTSITATRLRHQTGGSVLLQAALDNLPDGLISEGEVLDVDALAFAIKDFWKTHKIKGQRVSLGLANQKVVVRALDFPVMDEKELQSSIEFQAQDYIPIPAEEAVFAHHIMGTSIDEDGLEMQKVLIVAAQKDMVMDFINAVKKAKLQVDNIDLQAFAMMRAMRSASFLDDQGSREAIAIANIASDLTNIVVEVNGEPQFTRIISFGGDDFTRAVAEHQGLKFEEAELMKIKDGLPGSTGGHAQAQGEAGDAAAPGKGAEKPPGDYDGYGPLSGHDEGERQKPQPETGFGPSDERLQQEDGDEAPLSEEERTAQVQRILEIMSETLADELRRSFDYYMSQESAVPISMLLLSGGGALMPHLDSHLSQLFPFEVRMGDPSSRIVANKSDLTDEEVKALGPRLAIAIGLALEDEGP
ncbi:MAG: type IV pilus assembly protein PilM [Thermoleophilia bacterium]